MKSIPKNVSKPPTLGSSATKVAIMLDTFEFVQGVPRKITWKSDAGTDRFGWFCGDCGSRIAHGQEVKPVLTVRSGTLDDKSWVSPVGDIWTKSAQPWVELSGNRLRSEYQPADFGPYLEAFPAQGVFPD